MNTITTIQDAEHYINTFNFYDIINENKTELLNQFNICEQLAIENNYDKILCRTRTFMFYLFFEENKLQQATELAEQNLQFAKEKRLDDELLYMISLVAHLYQLTGNLSASEELIEIALDRIPTIKDISKICKIYSMVADQYFFTNKKNKCLETYKKCLEYAHQTNENKLISFIYNSYAHTLIKYNILEDAFVAIQIGEEYAKKCNDPYALVLINGMFGMYYFDMNDYKKAISYYKSQLVYFKASQNISNEMIVSVYLINAFLKTNQNKKAFQLLNSIEQLALKSDAKKILLDVYDLYVCYYEKKKKYEFAFNYLKKYNEIHEFIYNEQSDDKIKNLQITHEVKTIKQEREHAENMARIKHDFLANMSHEIRTPINSILGICYLLQQDYLTEKQLNYVKRLNYSGENLLGIINDVLDISKIEAGKFSLANETFSIAEVAKNTHQLLELKAIEKGLNFNLVIDDKIPIQCIGDSTRVNQILLNLLSNAIKFTKNGKIDLSIALTETNHDAHHLQFTISDTGIGMNDIQLQKIFNEYEQATDTTQLKFGGTGLGLSISKKLIELMNGTIDVQSQLNIGTTFNVQIPFKISQSQHTYADDSIPSFEHLSHKTIIIADDVEENTKVMSELLLSLNNNIQIFTATNGIEVIELLKKCSPVFIFMDLDMPLLNGFETTTQIQSNFPKNSIPIIACTASLLTISTDEMIALGFHDVLQKPFTIKQLINIIK